MTALGVKSRYQLAVQKYDRVASGLISALIVAGSAVLLMLGLWANWNWIDGPVDPGPPLDWKDASGAVEGLSADLEEPGLAELELPEPQLARTIAAVSDLVSRTQGALESLPGLDEVSSKGGGPDTRRLEGTPGRDGVLPPKWDRWQVRYNTSSMRAYAEQLDSLGIVLGAAGGGHREVDFVSNLAAARPTTRAGSAESRLYFSWRNGRLKQFDRQLLSKANVPTKDRVLLQFYPPELILQMEHAERQAAKKEGLTKFTKTVFELLPAGSDPPLRVVSIR